MGIHHNTDTAQFTDMLMYAKERDVIGVQYVAPHCIQLHDIKVMPVHHNVAFLILFSVSWTRLFRACRTASASSRRPSRSCWRLPHPPTAWSGSRYITSHHFTSHHTTHPQKLLDAFHEHNSRRAQLNPVSDNDILNDDLRFALVAPLWVTKALELLCRTAKLCRSPTPASACA